jgi:hypothetical protein
VEFSLTLFALLTIMLGIIEFGRLLQAWLTVQNSAQGAARYAITGQGTVDPSVDEWDTPRLMAIKEEARRLASSLRISASAGPFDPGYFLVSVHAANPPEPTPGAEFPGGPNTRVAVDVIYHHELFTPIVRSIAPWLRLTAHAEMVTERFRHPGYGTPPGVLPPTIAPTPTPTYTPEPAEPPPG